MTDHTDPAKLDISLEHDVPGVRPVSSKLSSEAEAAFYAMVTIINRIESSGVDNHPKAVSVLDARNDEFAKQVAAQNDEKPEIDEKAPHSRISTSLLFAGFMGGALAGNVLLGQGFGLGIIADGVVADHQVQTASLRPAEDIPARYQFGSGHAHKFLVQIGSYKSQTAAVAAWSTFAHDHPDASAHKPDIKTVDLGDMGVWHRLRLSNFADQKAARVYCEQLESDGAACLLGR